MSKNYPVGSTFEVVAGMKNKILTATSDLRELYVEFLKFMYYSNTNQIKCFKTIEGRKNVDSLEKVFWELHNELVTQYRYNIEFVDVQIGPVFVFCANEHEVIRKLQDIALTYKDEYSLIYTTFIVHDTVLAERTEGSIQTLVQKFKTQKVSTPALELKLDYAKEFGLLLNEAINGKTDEERIIAKHILAYLTNKMAKQKDNK